MPTRLLDIIRRWGWLLFVSLALVLILLLWLSPAERTLGQTVKLVYLHGALVRTAIVLFAVSLPVNLGALFRRRRDWLSWGKAVIWTAVATWLLHTLFSMVTTYVTWGVLIAWFEPRTHFTFVLAAVGVVMTAAAYFVADDFFSTLVFILLAGLTLGQLPYLGFIQHPLDPIGSSLFPSIRLFYAAILFVSIAMGGLATLLWQGKISARSTQPELE